MTKAVLTMMTARPWRRQTNATETAVFHVYCCSALLIGRFGPLGKKTRNRSKLSNRSVEAQHSDLRSLHHTEAEPLYTNLRDSQEPSSTLKCTDSLAAGHIRTRSWQDEDVGESACAGSCTQEDEVGRDAFRGATSDNSVVLGKVRH